MLTNGSGQEYMKLLWACKGMDSCNDYVSNSRFFWFLAQFDLILSELCAYEFIIC